MMSLDMDVTISHHGLTIGYMPHMHDFLPFFREIFFYCYSVFHRGEAEAYGGKCVSKSIYQIVGRPEFSFSAWFINCRTIALHSFFLWEKLKQLHLLSNCHMQG